jgi:hypothetical protein
VTGGILLAAEGYHRWLDQTEEFEISSYTYKGLFVDLMPTVTVMPDGRGKLAVSLGAGPSGMVQRIAIKSDAGAKIPLDEEIDFTLGGLAAQLATELKMLGMGFSIGGRYRFLTGEQKWENPARENTEKMQTWTWRCGLRIPFGQFRMLIGAQAENQVSWNQYQDYWPKWPKEWEYLGYAGVALMIR